MSPGEKRAIAAMMQRLVTFIAERRCLISILEESVHKEIIPRDWKRQLEQLRMTPQYKAILDQFAPKIRKFEEDAEIESLLPLIEQLSKGKLPN